jgi:serine protease Do
VAFVAAPSWAFHENGNTNSNGLFGFGAGQVAASGIQPIKWGQPGNLADLIEQVNPSVVQIVVHQPGRTQNLSSPFDQFRQFGFGAPGEGDEQAPRNRQTPDAMASGSGFIIDGRGYIVTNNHVVDSATKVTVKFTDGSEMDARIIGTDKRTDLAVIKIDGAKLPATLGWGDSDQARPGENVFAIGSPFGLGNTVTSGIVSARGRDLGGQYDDYIQVDAPINSGNSGGPLFNDKGQVIGINSAIYSPSGGNVGIGFSIPSNMAQKVVNSIIQHGSVARGWLGVSIGEVNRATADSLGIKDARGALVQDVTENSPASKAGLRSGDVILALGDHQVKDVHDLTRAVADVPANSTRDMRIFRDGREQTVKVTIAALKDDAVAAAPKSRLGGGSDSDEGDGGPAITVPGLGLELQNDGGAVVSDVDVHSTAYDAGIRQGDKIVRVGQADVKTAAAAAKAIAESKSKNAVLLQLERTGQDGKAQRRFVGVPFGKS